MRKSLLALVALAALSAPASAVPVHWTLTGVTFSDGGTASGSFVYDADINAYSSVAITTTAGTVFATGATLLHVAPGLPAASSQVLTVASGAADLTGSRAFALFFTPALTNAGGTLSLGGLESTCADATCSSPTETARSVTAGSVTGTLAATAIPTLPTWGLFSAGLLLGAAGFLVLRKGIL